MAETKYRSLANRHDYKNTEYLFIFKLQVHYNNPTRSTKFRDSSGMTLYYTSDLRPYDGGILAVQQTLVIIDYNII